LKHLVTYDYTLPLRAGGHSAFGNTSLGSHNFMVMALGSCVKWPLVKKRSPHLRFTVQIKGKLDFSLRCKIQEACGIRICMQENGNGTSIIEQLQHEKCNWRKKKVEEHPTT
jgi:hypothetical protein